MDYSECSHSLSHNHSHILIVEDEATRLSVFLINSKYCMDRIQNVLSGKCRLLCLYTFEAV